MRSMKWHIFNNENEPLCWDDNAIEFSTKESAERFLHSYVDTMYDNFDQYCRDYGIQIKECILFYDGGGYIDCSDKIVAYDDDGEEYLITV